MCEISRYGGAAELHDQISGDLHSLPNALSERQMGLAQNATQQSLDGAFRLAPASCARNPVQLCRTPVAEQFVLIALRLCWSERLLIHR